MASFIRRKRAFLLKILICIPILYLVSLVVFTANSDRTLPFPETNEKRHLEAIDQADPMGRLPGRDRNLHVIQMQPQADPAHNVDLGFQENKRQLKPLDVNIDHEVKQVGKVDMKVENKNRPDVQNIQTVVKTTSDPNAPGENGKGVAIDKDKLSVEDRKKFDEGWKNNAYNQFASDMISLHRSLPDVRDK
ncbi:unnamed protein product, partial [Candidula unifasciata]